MHQIQLIDLGLKEYRETWDFQQEIHSRLVQNKINGYPSPQEQYLLFVEHPHVYTLGKSGQENNLLVNPDFLQSINASFFKTDRGGDITYHGPGQIVGYPIFDLDKLQTGIRDYVHNLEQVIINTLKCYAIKAGRLKGATGVWVEPGHARPSRKICAIGVKVSRGITMHGFALNVNTNLNYFSHIHPCGFTDKTVTSLKAELKQPTDISMVKQELLKAMEAAFNIRINTAT